MRHSAGTGAPPCSRRRDAAHYVEHAIGKKRHKEFKRLRRRLAEAGPVAFEIARSPGTVTAALQDFLALEAKGWKGAAGTALIQNPAAATFCRNCGRFARPAWTGRRRAAPGGVATDRLHRDAPKRRRRVVLEDRL